jgi:hypothetical protein
MSRVDEDRDAARVAARLAEAKRTEEGQKSKKAAEGNAFSKLVQGQKKEAQVKQEGNLARSAIAQLLEAAEAGHADEAKHLEQGAQGTQQESAFRSKLGSKGQEQKVQQNTRSDGKQTEQVKEQGGQDVSQTSLPSAITCARRAWPRCARPSSDRTRRSSSCCAASSPAVTCCSRACPAWPRR